MTPISLFGIGDIVAFTTHPFFESLTSIAQGGEVQLLPPVMVVIEIMQNKKVLSESESTTKGPPSQYKCIWYSTRLHEFQEAWFREPQLKLIKKTVYLEGTQFVDDVLVSLKTCIFESGKIRARFNLHDGNSNQNDLGAEPNSVFVSPLMQIIQVAANENFGKRKGLDVCAYLAKCRWYNPKSEKYSEVFLPIDSLQIIAPVDQNKLRKIQRVIKKGRWLMIETNDVRSLIKPLCLEYRDCRYYVDAYDYILNENRRYEVDGGAKLVERENYFRDKCPEFDFSRKAHPIYLIEELLEMAIKKKSYLRIVYKNQKGKLTVRTLERYRFERIASRGKKHLYLTGYCHLKKEERTFSISQIVKAEILRLSFKKAK